MVTGVIDGRLEGLTVSLDHFRFGVAFCVSGGQIGKFAERKRERHAVIVKVSSRLTGWWVEHIDGDATKGKAVTRFDGKQLDIVCLDCVEVALVGLARRCDARVVGEADPVAFGFVVGDDFIVAANVVGVAVGRDEMVDPVDIPFLEVVDDVSPAVSPVTGVDEHRLAAGFDEERRIGLSNVDVVYLEGAVGAGGGVVLAVTVSFAITGAIALGGIGIRGRSS